MGDFEHKVVNRLVPTVIYLLERGGITLLKEPQKHSVYLVIALPEGMCGGCRAVFQEGRGV
jgi:hypothetical protein